MPGEAWRVEIGPDHTEPDDETGSGAENGDTVEPPKFGGTHQKSEESIARLWPLSVLEKKMQAKLKDSSGQLRQLDIKHEGWLMLQPIKSLGGTEYVGTSAASQERREGDIDGWKCVRFQPGVRSFSTGCTSR